MKVIDLLNEIAKGEQPSHIRMYGRDWYWNNYDGYVTEGSLSTTPDAQIYLFSQYRLDFALDKEVEIIEEDKEIEEIERHMISRNYVIEDEKAPMKERMGVIRELIYKNSTEINIVKDKINELVRELNELKKGK